MHVAVVGLPEAVVGKVATDAISKESLTLAENLA